LPTFMSYPRSFAFHKRRLSLVFDISIQSLCEPCANKQQRAMGFLTRTITRL